MKSKDLQQRLLYHQANKELPRQEKPDRIHHHQTSITRNVKGTILRRGRKKIKNMNKKISKKKILTDKGKHIISGSTKNKVSTKVKWQK